MKIYIGADHGGFEAKAEIMEYLKQLGHEVIDKGNYVYDDQDDFPDFAFPVAESVAGDVESRGILICKSSIGVAVAANKVKGIFASQIITPEDAIKDREHHDSNVITLSGIHQSTDEMKAILDKWLNTAFLGGKYQRRLDKIKNYELTH